MQNMVGVLGAFKEKYLAWMNLPSITKTDIIEIIIIAFLIYHVMLWFKNTRAWTLFKGLIVILVFVFVAALFQMNTILWIAGKAFNVGIVALVVVFQPELRKALEDLGRKNFVPSIVSIDFSRGSEEKFSERTVNELVKACYEMGKVKTGALIVIENDVSLAEYERTGIALDSILTSQLLINIFEKNTPLHDGAIIVRGDRVVSATCYLPLSDNYGAEQGAWNQTPGGGRDQRSERFPYHCRVRGDRKGVDRDTGCALPQCGRGFPAQ